MQEHFQVLSSQNLSCLEGAVHGWVIFPTPDPERDRRYSFKFSRAEMLAGKWSNQGKFCCTETGKARGKGSNHGSKAQKLVTVVFLPVSCPSRPYTNFKSTLVGRVHCELIYILGSLALESVQDKSFALVIPGGPSKPGGPGFPGQVTLQEMVSPGETKKSDIQTTKHHQVHCDSL